MRVLITGADGFIGKNLLMHLQVLNTVETIVFTRKNSVDDLSNLLVDVDWVFHLAGINRPETDDEFVSGNVGLTESLCVAIKVLVGQSQSFWRLQFMRISIRSMAKVNVLLKKFCFHFIKKQIIPFLSIVCPMFLAS